MPLQFTNTQIIKTLALVLFTAITLWVGLFYMEQWRDQAHAWVAVRDGTWWDVFISIPAHVHPFLWFFLVKILVILGLPYQSAVVLNVLFCSAAAALLLFKSPLPWWLTVVFIFGYPLFYEFAFPGRIYGMGSFLAFLVCYLFTKRHDQKIAFSVSVALLLQTHFLFLALGVPVTIWYFIEVFKQKTYLKKDFLIGLFILAASGFYLLWYLLQISQYSEIININHKNENILSIFGNGLTLEKEKYTILVLFTLLLFIFNELKRIPALFFTLSCLGFLFFAYQNVVPDLIRYYMMIPVIMVSILWITYVSPETLTIKNKIKKSNAKSQKNKPESNIFSIWNYAQYANYILFAICMSISAVKATQAVSTEIKQSHSDAENAAKFIIDNNLLSYEIVGHRSYLASAIVPYFPKGKKIWYADRKEEGTFLKFDTLYYNTDLKVSYADAVHFAMNKFPGNQKVLLLLSIPIPIEFESQWQLIYATQTPQIQRDEAYFIYRKK
ncbi:MAG: hypothetical protein ABI844_04745 [Saprospiraceae bacterium]